MFDVCGLKNIRVYPLAYTICYNDDSQPPEYRKALAINETLAEMEWLKNRYSGKREVYNSYGFSGSDLNRLIELLGAKADYREKHFETDRSFEWRGAFNFIVTGVKQPMERQLQTTCIKK